MERALAGYQPAVGYAVAEVTTAATYEMGELYRHLAADLMKSERPANLDAEALEQYDLLLEEQAFPFEEKAIEVHELNARRAADGLYDEWVRKSYAVLAEVEPARFGKQVEPEPFVANLALPAPAVAGGGSGAGREIPKKGRKAERCSPRPSRRQRSRLRPQQQFARAVQLLEAGDFAGARPLLEQLVASEPTLAAPAVNLGMLHAREGRWPRGRGRRWPRAYRRDPAERGRAQRTRRRAARERAASRTRRRATARRSTPTRRTSARTATSRCCSTSTCGARPRRCSTSRPTLSKSGTADRQVSGWIAELKRRVGDVAQTAGVQP